jgi:hypothetical protein
MCNYYYAIVRWRDYEQDLKYTGSIRKEVTCEEAEKTGKTCLNPTEMPWQSGITSIKGPYYKCQWSTGLGFDRPTKKACLVAGLSRPMDKSIAKCGICDKRARGVRY